MQDISFITIHPQFVETYFGFGAFRGAIESKSLQCRVVNLRDFALDQRGSVDDRPYGGGDGMVMSPEPLKACLASLSQDAHVILMSPAGRTFEHSDVGRLVNLQKPLVFICGRFGGVDQRFVDKYVDEQISIGAYVVSGGELPALMVADALVRFLPGALGHEQSASHDSYGEALEGRIEAPLYTRPPEFEGDKVPEVLMSGDHKAIAAWREQASKLLTAQVVRKKS